jgi:hypothetical protein
LNHLQLRNRSDSLENPNKWLRNFGYAVRARSAAGHLQKREFLDIVVAVGSTPGKQ